MVKLKLAFGHGLLLVLLLGFAVACEEAIDGEDTTEEDIPTAPAAESLTMDLAILPSAVDYDAEEGQAFLLQNSSYYNTARLVLAVVNINVARSLIWPVVMLRRAQTVQPTLVRPNEWLWSYEMTIGGRDLSVNLTGTIESDETRSWRMLVSSAELDDNGCCEDLLLLSGQSTSTTADQVTTVTGDWQMFDYRVTDEASAWYSIDYELVDGAASELVFTLDSADAATDAFGVGSTVTYAVEESQTSMTVNNTVDSATTVITWDRETFAGSYTGVNGQQVCWDTRANDSVNIDCSAN